MIFKEKELLGILNSGWGHLEGEFVWSIEKYASLIMPIKKQSKVIGMQLVMQPFINELYKTRQSIEIYCNGLFVLGRTNNSPTQDILFFEIHPSITAFGALKLDFSFPESESPKNLTISSDQRMLGYKFFELQIIY